jgi:hypothetical protein
MIVKPRRSAIGRSWTKASAAIVNQSRTSSISMSREESDQHFGIEPLRDPDNCSRSSSAKTGAAPHPGRYDHQADDARPGS